MDDGGLYRKCQWQVGRASDAGSDYLSAIFEFEVKPAGLCGNNKVVRNRAGHN